MEGLGSDLDSLTDLCYLSACLRGGYGIWDMGEGYDVRHAAGEEDMMSEILLEKRI